MDENDKVVSLLTEIRDNQLKQLEFQEAVQSDLAEQKAARELSRTFLKRTWPRLIAVIMIIIFGLIAFLAWLSFDLMNFQDELERRQQWDQHAWRCPREAVTVNRLQS